MKTIRGDCESCGRKSIALKEIMKDRETKKVCIYPYRIRGKRGEWIRKESCFEAFYKPWGWKQKWYEKTNGVGYGIKVLRWGSDGVIRLLVLRRFILRAMGHLIWGGIGKEGEMKTSSREHLRCPDLLTTGGRNNRGTLVQMQLNILTQQQLLTFV